MCHVRPELWLSFRTMSALGGALAGRCGICSNCGCPVVSPWQFHASRTKFVQSWISGHRREIFLRSTAQHNRAISRLLLTPAVQILRLPLCSSICALLRKQFCSSWAWLVFKFCGLVGYILSVFVVLYHVNLIKRANHTYCNWWLKVPSTGARRWQNLFTIDVSFQFGTATSKVVAKYDAGDGMLFQLVSLCLQKCKRNRKWYCYFRRKFSPLFLSTRYW